MWIKFAERDYKKADTTINFVITDADETVARLHPSLTPYPSGNIIRTVHFRLQGVAKTGKVTFTATPEDIEAVTDQLYKSFEEVLQAGGHYWDVSDFPPKLVKMDFS